MGFGKVKKEVADKNLDPSVAHKDMDHQGKLISHSSSAPVEKVAHKKHVKEEKPVVVEQEQFVDAPVVDEKHPEQPKENVKEEKNSKTSDSKKKTDKKESK